VNYHTRDELHGKPGHNFYLSEEDLDTYAEFYASEARDSLWAYRRFMDPDLVLGWFPRAISQALQEFYDDLIAGKRPKLILEAPPQHGKTRNIQDFLGWVAGKNPDLKQIYASFSSDLGVDANTAIQRQMLDEKYAMVFPDTIISTSNVVTVANKPKKNSRFIEFAGRKGSFRNTTVNGQITGKTLHLGVIDDPIKGRAEASSKNNRDKAWSWLMDDFMTRFDDQAGMILMATRWHVDDPTGRFLLKFPHAKVLKFPAMSIAADPERPRLYDLRRREGIPLFPQFKSKPFLLERRAASTVASWESLYQQSPIIVGGGVFPIERIKMTSVMPEIKDIKRSVRYWDKAGTTDDGAFTAGVLMHELFSGGWLISNVVRGQWGSFKREEIIKATAERDAQRFGFLKVKVVVEQEPGSGGKESAERSIANLAGHKVEADRVTGQKEVRADPYAAQWQGGNITLLVAPWNDAFLDEHEAWPNSKYKDQVDAAAAAFVQVVGKKYAYDTSMKWAAN
jgi:predicted phage terminase large subunit-like protein